VEIERLETTCQAL